MCVQYVVFLLYWGFNCCCLRCCCLCYYCCSIFGCCWVIHTAFTPPCTPDICAKWLMIFFAFLFMFCMLYFCCVDVSIVVVWGAVVYVIIIIQYLDVVGSFILHLLHPLCQISEQNYFVVYKQIVSLYVCNTWDISFFLLFFCTCLLLICPYLHFWNALLINLF